MTKLLAILSVIAEILQRFLKKKREVENENENQIARAQPVDWFRKHFGRQPDGVQNDKPIEPANLPDDAGAPSKADPDAG